MTVFATTMLRSDWDSETIMTQNAATDQELLAKFAAGHGVDWNRKRISANHFSETLHNCSKAANGPSAFAIFNAIIDGDVDLDGIGDFGSPLALQIVGCEIRGGFRARGSKWRQLLIAKSSVHRIDIPNGRFESDLLLENTKSASWLELRSSDIGGTLALNGSEFAKGDRAYAMELSEVHVGRSIRASRLTALGRVNAGQLHVEGRLGLEGSNLTVPPDEGVVLDLKGAKIGGEVCLCFGAGRRFEASGIVICMSAEFGALTLRGSKLSGRNNIAFIGDHLVVRETIDVGGLSDQGNSPFEADGKMRFIGASVGRQFQLFDATLTANDGFALSLDSCRIGADVLIGHPESKLTIHGGLSANSICIGGRFILAGATLLGKADALSMREAKVGGEVTFYDGQSKGAFRLDSVKANQFLIDNFSVERTSPTPSEEDLPQAYAHPEDALLDFSFAEFNRHVKIDKLNLDGGDLRFIGAKIDGGIQLSRISICSPRHAIVGQSARISRGFYIAGTRQTPAVIEGTFNLMGALIDGDITIVDARIGTPDVPVDFCVRGIRISGGLNFTRTVVSGELNASAAAIEQDFILNGVHLSAHGKTACDLRTTQVGGVLQLSSAGTEGDTTDGVLDGDLTADGAEIGALEWYTFRITDGAKLLLTNMRITRKIHAGGLAADKAALIDLTGTSVAELTDTLDDRNDGWGAGKAALVLESFRYDRLTYPTGRDGGLPSDVRHWRSLWLKRRANQQSSRPAHHLAKVLREQGMFEASRLVLIDAFAAEGQSKPTPAGRALAWFWGGTFGFGLSGNRAIATLMFWWLIGVWGVAYLQNADLLIADAGNSHSVQSCAGLIDPFIFSADLMLPILDLGEEKLCHIGLGPTAKPEFALFAVDMGGWAYRLNWWQIFRVVLAVYAFLGWLIFSLAIATWSGIFRRSGRQ